MEKLRTIVKVAPSLKKAYVLELFWSDGTCADVSIESLLRKKAYAALKAPGVFAKVAVGEWGHSIVWPGDIELGAESLWRMTLEALGRVDTLEFLDWRVRHGLSLSAAAEALGISRRMVSYYCNGSHAVPRTVLLACKGWEVSAA